MFYVVCFVSENFFTFNFLLLSLRETQHIFINCLQNADSNLIKKAYRRLLLQLHPDKSKAIDAEKAFRQVSAILSEEIILLLLF